MSRQLQIEIEEFMLSHNINQITSFHNELKRLIANEIKISKHKECFTNEDERNLLHIENIYTDQIHPKLINNTFLMLYAFLEEMLCIIVNSFSEKEVLSIHKYGLDRFKANFKGHLRIEISKYSGWQFLTDAVKIRNALLHANGNITLTKNRGEIEKIVTKYQHIKVERNILYVEEIYLNNFVQHLHGIKDWLLEKINT